MYVRRKKYVKRKGSSEESTNWLTHTVDDRTRGDQRFYKSLVSMSLILALVVSMPIAALALKPMQVMLFHVDPAVQEALMLGNSVDAYVSVRADADIGLRADRVWHIGDIKIVKVRLTSTQQLSNLLHKPGVISIYASKKFRHAPLYFFDVSQYPFEERDIDNEFHEAYGPWIGRNVTVAIVDTGIDYTHPDFYDENNRSIIKVLTSMLYVSASSGEYIFWEPYKNGTMEDLLNYDMAIWQRYGEPAFLDINGHGTHVAGIIAGRGHASDGKYKGIAPDVELVIVKAFDENGVASMDMCLEALEWIYNNTEKYGIKILSISWGSSFASDGNDPLSLAVDELVEKKGVWVFAAAGNEGNLPTTVVVPAVARKAFAVGAWDPYYDKVAPFSSLGPTVDMRMKPDFMGAGVMIVSCKSSYVDYPDEYEIGEYYVAMSGTSMSTPAVAAVAADFIEYFRYWNGREPTAEDFVRWVEYNGRRINFVKDFLTGWGIPKAPHT